MTGSAKSEKVSYVSVNAATRAKIDTGSTLSIGSFKTVFQGVYVSGENKGKRCVAKVIRDADPYVASAFDMELAIVKEATDVIRLFNQKKYIGRTIFINVPEVWQFEEGGQLAGVKCLVEPMLHNFTKFNSNTGWTPHDDTDWTAAMQALSHFSYHISGGDVVLCDMQGGTKRKGVCVTDLVVLSRTQAFGPTDFGAKGITAFFSRHTCNQYCQKSWHKPKFALTDIPIKQGSSLRNSQGELMSAAGVPVPGPIIVGPRMPAIKEEPEGASAASLAPSALSGLSSWRGRKARYQNANAGDNLSGKKRKRSKASAAPGTNAQLPVKNFPARGADCPPTPSLRTHVKLQYCSKYK